MQIHVAQFLSDFQSHMGTGVGAARLLAEIFHENLPLLDDIDDEALGALMQVIGRDAAPTLGSRTLHAPSDPTSDPTFPVCSRWRTRARGRTSASTG